MDKNVGKNRVVIREKREKLSRQCGSRQDWTKSEPKNC